MKVLVSGSTATMRRQKDQSHLGVFFNPNSRSNYRRQMISGMAWAADNAAFTNFDAEAYLLMLDTLRIRALPRCLFVTIPDVVSDAAQTIAAFWRWQGIVRRYGWPLAFVAQDGLTARQTPWAYFDVLFIGGSTRWKLGADAYTLCGYAKALGKHVHIGRVNSPLRLNLFATVADSIDGTATSRYGNLYIPTMIAAIQQRTSQRRSLQREFVL